MGIYTKPGQPDHDPKGTRSIKPKSPRLTTAKGDAQDKLPVTGAAQKVAKVTDGAQARIESIHKGEQPDL